MHTEKNLQVYTKKQCKLAGISCYKFSSPAYRGVPDLLLVYKGQTVFVELKSPAGTGRLSELQKREIEKLRAQGMSVHVAHTPECVDEILEAMTDVR